MHFKNLVVLTWLTWLSGSAHANRLSAQAVNSTFHVKPSAQVVIIVPIHPPKYPWMCQFLQSGKSHKELPIIPVFAEQDAVTEFIDAYGDMNLLQPHGYMIVHPGKSMRPIIHKKFVAIWRIFNETKAKWVIAADAETQLQPAFMKDSSATAGRFLRTWDRQRTVIASNVSGLFHGHEQKKRHAKADKMVKACQAVGLPPVQPVESVFPWWTDAPIYAREDYADFVSMLRKHNDFMDPSFDRALPYDHLLYLCYKIQVQEWRVHYVDYVAEDLDCGTQQKLAPSHEFTWSRDVCSRTLLTFHLDRNGAMSFRDPSSGKHAAVEVPRKQPKCFAGWKLSGGAYNRIGMPAWGNEKKSTRNEVLRRCGALLGSMPPGVLESADSQREGVLTF